jgi:hypothetical protein
MGLHRKPSGLEYRWLCGSRDLVGGGGLQRGPEARRKLVTRFISLGCAAGTIRVDQDL